jgi:hypothetical protein
VNPIGSHRKKHKITAFYWSLLSIPVEYRSNLRTIQLLALTRTRDVRTGTVSILLQNFVSSLKSLWDGVILDMPSGKEHCYGMLAVVMADTPAAQYLGGFKESVAFAEKPCRLCEISRQQLSQVVTASEIPLRD